ncbi:MAG: gliding motility-associated C-terminal domain-containing protein, partial [Bacteroidota bacterium]|nr:gliding motility-associated C-terminal domain-containing protein [Bacteroidota bacterium]
FTPNEDMVNDQFKVLYLGIKQFSLKIFNRWGQIVFSTSNPEIGWDGKYNGKDCPVGNYFYIIQAVSNNEKFHYNGSINLIR